MLLRFEDSAYLNQWVNFRKPKISDMEYDEENKEHFIDTGICRLYINLNF